MIAVFLPIKWLVLFPGFRGIHRSLLMVLVTTEVVVIVCFAKEKIDPKLTKIFNMHTSRK